MKRLITIGLSCLLMTGCGEPLPDDVAPSAAAPSLDALDEIMGDALTMEAVEEQASTDCRRPDEVGTEEVDPSAAKKPVVSCGNCEFSVNDLELRYNLTFLPPNELIQLEKSIEMKLVSSVDPEGFEASFSGPPRGTRKFERIPLNSNIVSLGTTMRLSTCIAGVLFSFEVNVSQ